MLKFDRILTLGAFNKLACVFFGPLKVPGHEGENHGGHGEPAKNWDIGAREVALLTPLAVMVFVLGFMPTPFLDSIRGPLDEMRTPAVVAMRSVDGMRVASAGGIRREAAAAKLAAALSQP